MKKLMGNDKILKALVLLGKIGRQGNRAQA